MLSDPNLRERSSAEGRVTVTDLHKSYSDRKSQVHALSGVSLTVKPGKMVVLLGPSGCGKTTLLRSIAGLEQPHQGTITVGGRVVYSAEGSVWVPPERRGLSMVFQSYALWPHMSVYEQVAYPLQCRRVAKPEVAKRVMGALEMVGLHAHADRLPAQLSGGQQQRVALARAVVSETGVVLFDEPLSNVDAKVREQVRQEIMLMQRRLEFAGVYVTHDQVEAGAIADELVVMDHGRIVQVGSPQEVYERPNSRYVANFVGVANELVGTSLGSVDEFAGVSTPLGTFRGVRPAPQSSNSDAQVVAIFRPEACTLHAEHISGVNVLDCTIRRRMFMGANTEYLLDIRNSGKTAIVQTPRGTNYPEGTRVWLKVDPRDVRILDVA